VFTDETSEGIMTKRLCLSVLAAVLSLAIAAPAYPVKADETKTVTIAKKKHKRHVAKQNHSAYPALEPFRSSGFIGPYPGSCAYDRAAGNCMIDLGYGRCEPCDIGGNRP
jgi:hypothetical protein